MANTSPEELALRIAAGCLKEGAYRSSDLQELTRQALDADPAVAGRASRALFQVVVEALADRFDPRLADCYAELFSEVVARALPGLDRSSLLARYTRVRRRNRPPARDPQQIFVLSRVTLGADIAITSVLLDGLKRRYPRARILFTGPRKNWELFAADPRVEFAEVSYRRDGLLSSRLAAYQDLQLLLQGDNLLVIDPDSRLTQLGLLPVCDEDRYLLFDTRAYGGTGTESVAELARRWMGEVFGIGEAMPFVAPVRPQQPRERFDVTVSLGVGENPAKGLGGGFERELLETLAAGGWRVLLDLGASQEEASRARAAARGLSAVSLFSGSFAQFVSFILESALYCGYDSAGQHAAAAAGVPLVCIFAGYPCERFLARWKPFGSGARTVIPAAAGEPGTVLAAARAAILAQGPSFS